MDVLLNKNKAKNKAEVRRINRIRKRRNQNCVWYIENAPLSIRNEVRLRYGGTMADLMESFTILLGGAPPNIADLEKLLVSKNIIDVVSDDTFAGIISEQQTHQKDYKKNN